MYIMFRKTPSQRLAEQRTHNCLANSGVCTIDLYGSKSWPEHRADLPHGSKSGRVIELDSRAKASFGVQAPSKIASKNNETRDGYLQQQDRKYS